MKKGLVFLVAALLVVGLPLSSLAGTEVYKVKDAPYYMNDIVMCFDYPYGPAKAFGKSVCLVIENATTSETVRIKYPKGYSSANPGVTPPDVGWNRVGHGQVTVFDNSGGPVFMSAMSFAEKIVGVKAPAPSPSVWGEVLHVGPFQLEEVVQDDGNKVGCWSTMGDELSFERCWSDQYDYVMYHWKLTGNSINAFWKTTVKNGERCITDAANEFCEPVQTNP